MFRPELEIKKVTALRTEPDCTPYECIVCPAGTVALWRVSVGSADYRGSEDYDLCEFHKDDIETLFSLYQQDLDAQRDHHQELKIKEGEN